MVKVGQMLKVLESFYRKLEASEPKDLWIAISGGMDSVLLLQHSVKLKESGKIPGFRGIKALHINHGLRGEESNGDEAFVRSLCDSLEIPLEIRRLIWLEGQKPSQAACRKKREAIYHELVGDHWLALGHHSDDLAETIFLRLLRGTGARGIAPMQAIQRNRLRPFLEISRADIYREVQALEFAWREDSSNGKLHYERNWVRHEIFPALEKRRPGFSRRLIAFAEETHALAVNEPKLIVPRVSFYEEGALFRTEDLAALPASQIHSLFPYNRHHTAELKNFFQSHSGKYELPGMLLWNSCGLLLAWKGKAFRSPKFAGSKQSFLSLLGKWSLSEPSGEITMRRYQRGENSKWKAKLITCRVPAFFRTEIPVLKCAREETILVPRNLGRSYDFTISGGAGSFEPSAMAQCLASELHFQFGDKRAALPSK